MMNIHNISCHNIQREKKHENHAPSFTSNLFPEFLRNILWNLGMSACARLGADARALGRFGARVGATFGLALALLLLAAATSSPYTGHAYACV